MKAWIRVFSFLKDSPLIKVLPFNPGEINYYLPSSGKKCVIFQKKHRATLYKDALCKPNEKRNRIEKMIFL